MDKGVYLLLLRLPKKGQWSLRGSQRDVPAGYYAYVGSAMNGLSARIARHARTSHAKHWHVDDLLARGRIVDVQVRQTERPEAECELAAEVLAWPEATPVDGFGATDCTCGSHLAHFRQRPGWSLLADDVLGDLPAMFAIMSERYVDHAAQDRDPFETLAKCLLSLRTQDPVTDAAAERLFARMRTPQALADSDPEVVASLIYPVGMYRQKARRLKDIGRILLDEYDGAVPSDIDSLVQLPGVGRKTANLVRSFAFHKPAICVDTHVHRITNRWGLVRTATPDETELALREVLPGTFWMPINGFLVQHGQQICRPQRPKCANCPLRFGCRYEALRAEQALLAKTDAPPGHPTLKLQRP